MQKAYQQLNDPVASINILAFWYLKSKPSMILNQFEICKFILVYLRQQKHPVNILNLVLFGFLQSQGIR